MRSGCVSQMCVTAVPRNKWVSSSEGFSDPAESNRTRRCVMPLRRARERKPGCTGGVPRARRSCPDEGGDGGFERQIDRTSPCEIASAQSPLGPFGTPLADTTRALPR